MQKLTMKHYQQIINRVIAQVEADGGQPVAIAVCDGHGVLTALMTMDNVPVRCAHQARHKAYTAARMQATTASFQERLKREEVDIRWYCDPDLTLFPGGAPIVAADGTVLGAVGISGRPSEEDQKIANRVAQIES